MSLHQIAARNVGLLTTADFDRHGVSPKVVARLARDGFIAPVFPRVWRTCGVPPPPRQKLRAAIASVGQPVGASHRSAVDVWEVPFMTAATIELAVPTRRGPRLDGVLLHHTSAFNDDQITVRDGITVTTPARTLLDMGAVVPRYLVHRALEHWLTRRIVTMDAIRAVLDEVGKRGRNGTAALRALVDARSLGDAPADSGLEVLTADLLRDAGLDAVYHHLVVIDGRVVAELDFAFVAERVYLECDGFQWHSSRTAFDRDRDRQNLLSELGWIPVRFSDRQLRHHGPAAMARTKRVLHARRIELGHAPFRPPLLF